MKLSTVPVVGLGMLLSSCFASREALIESDYSYGGNFRYYRTFSFMTASASQVDSAGIQEVMQDAIRSRLRIQGYRQVRNHPDLLVSYRIYEGDMPFRGFAQEDLTTWMAANRVEDDATPKEKRQGYQPLRLLLHEGTLMITLIDSRTNRAVWNGYASGFTVPTGAQGELTVRRSVRSIFDRYRVFTQGYLEANQSR